MSQTEIDLAIVGGGIGGAMVARAAAKRGLSGLVFDQTADWRASEAPLAMLHPFPGRSLDRKPESLTAFAAAAHTMRAAIGSHAECGRLTHMLRPLDELQGIRLRETLATERESLAEQGFDVNVLDAAELQHRYPALAPETPAALTYGPAFAMDMGALRSRVLAEAATSGLELVAAEVTALRWKNGSWELRSATGPLARACRVVLAPGASLASWFPDLGIKVAGGELCELDATGLKFAPLISASGTYLGLLGDHCFVGATRWPWSERHLRSDNEAGKELRQRGAALLPALENADIVRVWRGARAVLPRGRREPVAGSVPGYPNLAVLGALGGKGLLWSTRGAEFALAALAGESTAALVDPAALPDRWSSPRIESQSIP